MKKILPLLIILLFPVMVFGAEKKEKQPEKLTLTCDKLDKINVNEQIICRISTNVAFYFNRISFDVIYDEGIQIVDVRSNYSDRWKLEKDENGRYTVVSSDIQSDLQEFGIVLIKAVKDGKSELKIDNVVLENSLEEENIETLEIDAVSKEFKIVSSDNLLKSLKVDDEDVNGFSKDVTKYYINIGDKTSIKIEAESNNAFATIKGIGEIKLNAKTDYFVVPVSVISEDGASKIYSLYLYRSDNAVVQGLDSLNIVNDRNNTLLISFNPEVSEYNIEVDNNTKYLKIKPTASSGYKFVKNYGEQKVDILSGNNLIQIKIEDKDGNIYTYILNITKPIAGKSSNNFIKTLLIKNYKMAFNKRVKNYTLYIDPNDTTLDITPILESNTSRYTISGNKDLKEGSVIKIEVTAENEEKTTYKINIKIKEEKSKSYIIFIILGGLLIVGAGIKFKDKLISLFKIEGKDKDKVKEEVVKVVKDTVVDVVKEVLPVEEKKTNTKPKTNTTKKKTTTKPKTTAKKTSSAKKNTTAKKTTPKKKTNTTKKKTTTTKKKTPSKKK